VTRGNSATTCPCGVHRDFDLRGRYIEYGVYNCVSTGTIAFPARPVLVIPFDVREG